MYSSTNCANQYKKVCKPTMTTIICPMPVAQRYSPLFMFSIWNVNYLMSSSKDYMF